MSMNSIVTTKIAIVIQVLLGAMNIIIEYNFLWVVEGKLIDIQNLNSYLVIGILCSSVISIKIQRILLTFLLRTTYIIFINIIKVSFY